MEKSNLRIRAILNDPSKTEEFFAKNPFAKVFYTENQKTSSKILAGTEIKDKLANRTGKKSPIILEVGCHHGALLRRWAERYPEINFVGMDVTYKRVVRTALGRNNLSPLKNLTSILHNAQDISGCFSRGDLSGVCLFFPDPWPKKRQRKHRYVNEVFMGQVQSALKPGGFFWFKSDDLSYYRQAFKAATGSGFTFEKQSSGAGFKPFKLIAGPMEAHCTLFEKKFWDKKQRTYQFICIKTDG